MTTLPTYAECAAVPPEKRTALERFIAWYYPRGIHEKPWRDQLTAVIEEERAQAAERFKTDEFNEQYAAMDKIIAERDRLRACVDSDAEVFNTLYWKLSNNHPVKGHLHGCMESADAIIAQRDALAAALEDTRKVRDEWCDEYTKARDERDAYVERSVGAMAIADGEEGYEKVPIDCPMLAAVSELRSKYNALLAELSRRDNSQTALPKAAV